MAENKTKLSKASVVEYLQAIKDPIRREDCVALCRLMEEATKHPAKMWGTSIVGFGSYHYKYASRREGDMCMTGFSSRKNAITIYLVKDFPDQGELLANLGKHTRGKSCIYIKHLTDIDLSVLTQLISGTVAERRRVYG
jgi:hypothetical protein